MPNEVKKDIKTQITGGQAKKNNNKLPEIFKFSWKRIIFLILAAIAIYFIGSKLIGVKEGVKLIRNLHPGFIIGAIIFEALSYVGGTIMLKYVFSRLYYKIRFRDLFRLATIGNFAIHFFPVAGAGEMTILLYLFREKGLASGDTLFMFLIRAIFMYLALFVLFILSLLLVPVHPQLSASSRIIAVIVGILVILFIIWAVDRIYHKDRFYRSGYNLFKFINFFGRIFVKKPFIKQEKVNEIVDEVYLGFELFKKDRKSAIGVFTGGLIYWIGDIMCLFLILYGFGYFLGPGPLIFTYAVTTFVSIISFIPGGVGVNESVSSLLLMSFGVPPSTALFSVLVYRLISFWLIIPVGFISFLGLRNAREHILKTEDRKEINQIID